MVYFNIVRRRKDFEYIYYKEMVLLDWGSGREGGSVRRKGKGGGGGSFRKVKCLWKYYRYRY